MAYTVITKVAAPETGGNLATGLATVMVKVEEGNARNGWIGRFEPASSVMGMGALALHVPVFRVGEVLFLDENDRDQFGRKPSKWDIETEAFGTAEEAFACALRVTEEQEA